jgi:lipopolysaccharide transport protein LptA
MGILFLELAPRRHSAARRGALALAATSAIFLLTGASGIIKEDSLKGPITWESGPLDVDYKTHLMHMRGGVKISEGDISITADEAQASNPDSSNSHWVLIGKVHVRSESRGDLQGDRATVEIVQGELASAVVTGSPAQFEQTRSQSDRLVKGHAATIDYEVPAGTIQLTGDAWLSDAQNDNELRDAAIIYNIRAKSLASGGNVPGGGRVHLKIQPKADPASTPNQANHDAGQGKP